MIRTLLRYSVRRPIHLVTSRDQCHALVERILSSNHKSIAVDCEGAQLGRFGHLSLVQLATDQEVFLLDVLSSLDVVQPLLPLFETQEIVKVFHDCREDASLLFHQHKAPLVSVFDTQVGHAVWLEQQGLEVYQASIAEVLRTFRLKTYRSHRWDELERKAIIPQRWRQRPLEPQCIRYAVEGVVHLLSLQQSICRELGDPNGDLVLRRSVRYVDYAHLNCNQLPTQDISGLKPDAPLQAMVASQRPDAIYFKLNHGNLTGAVFDSKERSDFADVQPGDVVHCRVKSLSDCKNFVHLQREGHGNLFFDRRQREMRVLPKLKDYESRQSSLYGFGERGRHRGPAISEEPASFQEQRSEIFHKLGKRGRERVRKPALKPPKQQEKQVEHRTFPAREKW